MHPCCAEPRPEHYESGIYCPRFQNLNGTVSAVSAFANELLAGGERTSTIYTFEKISQVRLGCPAFSARPTVSEDSADLAHPRIVLDADVWMKGLADELLFYTSKYYV